MREEQVRLQGEIDRLMEQLRAVESARAALEGKSGGGASGGRRRRAPKGFLARRIVEVLRAAAEEPLGRARIIEALRAGGYEFTLAPTAITRELIALTRARRIRRIGADNDARYTAVVRGGSGSAKRGARR